MQKNGQSYITNLAFLKKSKVLKCFLIQNSRNSKNLWSVLGFPVRFDFFTVNSSEGFNNSKSGGGSTNKSFDVGVDGVELHLFSEKWQLPNWRRQREAAKMVTMCPGLFFIFNINPERSSKRYDLWDLPEVETPFTFCFYWEDFHFLHDLFACLSVCLSVCWNSQWKQRICSPTFSNITVVPCSPGLCSQCSPSPPSPHGWCLQRRGRETCHEREMNTKFTLNESEHLLK